MSEHGFRTKILSFSARYRADNEIISARSDKIELFGRLPGHTLNFVTTTGSVPPSASNGLHGQICGIIHAEESGVLTQM